VVAVLVFLVPISCVVFFNVILGYDLLSSVVFTVVVFLVCCLVFYLFFHRNPKRDIITDDRAVLSPADGSIVYIKEIEQGSILESVKKKSHMRLTELLNHTDADSASATGYIIGIELRLFDVHVTRAPITGVKLLDHHVSGRIVSMNTPGFESINDRETVLLRQDTIPNESHPLQIAVVQIATVLTRTMRSFVREKTHVTQGELIGMIRLGSQVDLVIYSKDVGLLVKEHDRVYAGITKIAERVSA
jgi:phosphatidylserine decarboxylase